MNHNQSIKPYASVIGTNNTFLAIVPCGKGRKPKYLVNNTNNHSSVTKTKYHLPQQESTDEPMVTRLLMIGP